MATTLSYTVAAFQPLTKIISADMESKLTDIKNRFNWDTTANTGLGDDNVQSNTVSGGGLTRNTKLKAGTANYVVINDANGKMTEEASLAISRGGLGTDFSASLATNAGAAVVVNAAGNALALGSPVQQTLIETLNTSVSGITAGATLVANAAVALDLARDASNSNLYRVFNADSSVPSRRASFAGFTTASASVVAGTYTWVASANFVASNVITYSINGRLYSTNFTTDNATTLQAVATQMATDPDVNGAVSNGSHTVTVTGKGGLFINITGSVVTAGASQATITVTNTQAPSGTNVQIQVFGPMAGFSGLSVGADYYLSTAGNITAAPTDTNPIFVGQALSTTVLFVNRNSLNFQFTQPQIFVRSTGSSDNSAANVQTNTEHFNLTSWSTGVVTTSGRLNGQSSDSAYNSKIYVIDGVNSAGSATLTNNSYNRTSWSTETARTTVKHSGAVTVLSGNMYVGGGRQAATFYATCDKYNGSSWTEGAGNFAGNGRVCNGAFTQGGFARFLGGTDGTSGFSYNHTFDGSSVGADTVVPASTTWGGGCASSAGGIIAASASAGTASYVWSGSWSASITLTYAPNPVATNGGTRGGQAQGYFNSQQFSVCNGGYNSNALTTTAQFNGAAWAAGTASSTAREQASGGVI